MKPRTPRLINDCRNIILDKLLPLRRTEIDGLTFFYKRDPPQNSAQLRQQGFEFHEKIKEIIGDVAVDVGANIGSYSLQLSRKFRKVVAFEPDPVHRHLLRLNVASNRLENVQVEELALSDQNGMMPLYIRRGGATSLDPYHYGRTWSQVFYVKVTKLDDFQLPPGKLNFVKIDAENLELPILRGTRQLLAKFCPTLAIEVHQARIIDRNGCRCDVCCFLQSLGYDTEVTGAFLSSGGSAHWVWATAT